MKQSFQKIHKTLNPNIPYLLHAIARLYKDLGSKKKWDSGCITHT